MPSFTGKIKHAQQAIETGLPLVWTPAHQEWMSRSHHDQEYSDAAIEHALRTYRGDDIPKREGEQRYRFSASRVGGTHGTGFNCHRQTLFNYIGAPKRPLSIAQQDHMNQGSALHLLYQMEGISAGYITSCETWEWHPTLRYGAKDDGILADGSLLELKFNKGDKYKKIVKGDPQYGQPPGPLHSHLLQITGLMMLKGLDFASLVYLSKDDGDYMEYRRALDPALVLELVTLLGDLNDWVNLDELPDMLTGCYPGSNTWMWKNCEFAPVCPKLQALTAALAL